MPNYAIIVAGGSGARMSSTTPKQFLELAGKPVLMHTIEKFASFDPALKIIVVLPEKDIPAWESLCSSHGFNISHNVVKGGATRFHSVSNGLNRVEEEGIVAVHDGVRPLLTASLIRRCFSVAGQKGNAVPFVPIRESIRKVTGEKNEYADRNSFVSIQTPQCFSAVALKKAYSAAYNDSFTDDASVIEAHGEQINLVEGEPENIKITFPVDLAMAEAILNQRK